MAKTKNPSVPLVVKLIAVVALAAVILGLAKTHTDARTKIQTLENQLKDARQKLNDTETQAAADKNNLQALTEQLVRQYELQSLQKQAGNANKTAATRGKLVAILFSPQNPSVVIDDNILHTGDSLHGVKVIRIYPDYVELAKNEKTWTQKLYQPPPAQWNEDK
jgi:septal ring factor EnvC (AmiA/AmiB activator)